MEWQRAPATAGLAIGTFVVSLAILTFGWLGSAAVYGGFIPMRFDPALGDVHGFLIPTWLTPLTATLVHGGFAHLALNLVMLGYCGMAAERAVGARGVLVLYVVGAYAAAVGHYALATEPETPMIGASGAISAIVGAYSLLFGERRAKAIGPVPADVVHVAWLAAAWVGLQLAIGFAGMGGGVGAIAIGAHIGGFIAGLLLARPLLLWRYRHA